MEHFPPRGVDLNQAIAGLKFNRQMPFYLNLNADPRAFPLGSVTSAIAQRQSVAIATRGLSCDIKRTLLLKGKKKGDVAKYDVMIINIRKTTKNEVLNEGNLWDGQEYTKAVPKNRIVIELQEVNEEG